MIFTASMEQLNTSDLLKRDSWSGDPTKRVFLVLNGSSEMYLAIESDTITREMFLPTTEEFDATDWSIS